ncbi:LEM-3-like GIY-YIG domain-containing protein [Aquitalea pelogenes]|uniref:LEM-3-like GIY-YIG domain-containing protein n=1 Tax=Aquitalea pelogenes TaxID=1293573 RepID=UPI0035AE47F6
MSVDALTVFTAQARKALGFYVYALTDPRTREIFYVGKASANNRAFDHLKAKPAESKKSQRIEEIRSATGQSPLVEVLRYGLQDEETAFEVEAAIIDAIGLENLTNEVRGHGVQRGRILASEVNRFSADPVAVSEINEPCMLFYIQNTYSPTLSAMEVYDSVRQFWHGVSAKEREQLEHRTALGIVDGVVVVAYEIEKWFEAGKTMSSRTRRSDGDDRWEFVGRPLHDHVLVGKLLVDDDGLPIPARQKGYSYLPLK